MRKHQNANISGPFTTDDLATRLLSGEMSSFWEATQEGPERTPGAAWFCVSTLPELAHLYEERTAPPRFRTTDFTRDEVATFAAVVGLLVGIRHGALGGAAACAAIYLIARLVLSFARFSSEDAFRNLSQQQHSKRKRWRLIAAVAAILMIPSVLLLVYGGQKNSVELVLPGFILSFAMGLLIAFGLVLGGNRGGDQ